MTHWKLNEGDLDRVHPYVGYKSASDPKGCVFLAAVVINRVIIVSILVSNGVCPLVLNCVCFLQEATF